MAYSFGDFHSRAKLKEWLSSQALAGGLECVGFLQKEVRRLACLLAAV